MYTVPYCRYDYMYGEWKRIMGCLYILLLLPLLRWLPPCCSAYRAGVAPNLRKGWGGACCSSSLHTPPLPSAEFTSPGISWPVSVSIHALGSSRLRGELPVKTLLVDFPVGWGRSLCRQHLCLLPCLPAAWHRSVHVVPSSWHLTAHPGHLQRAMSPSSGAVLPLSSSGTAVHPLLWILVPRLVSLAPAGLCWVTQRRPASRPLNTTCNSWQINRYFIWA